MPVVVRRAGRRDLDAIQSLWRRAREHDAKRDSRLALAPNAERSVSEHREVTLADPRTAFLVAEDKGELIGFLHAQISPNDPAYKTDRYGTIVDLFIAEERRRQGIGSRLLDYCKEWFVSHNLSEYRVATPVHTPDAARFLEQQGAQPLSVVYSSALDDDPS